MRRASPARERARAHRHTQQSFLLSYSRWYLLRGPLCRRKPCLSCLACFSVLTVVCVTGLYCWSVQRWLLAGRPYGDEMEHDIPLETQGRVRPMSQKGRRGKKRVRELGEKEGEGDRQTDRQRRRERKRERERYR